MHEDIEPYKPDWEYFGFTKDGPPPLPNSDTAAAPSETQPALPEGLENDTQQDSLSSPPLSRLPSRVLSVMKRLEHMKTTDPTHHTPERNTQIVTTPADIDYTTPPQPAAEPADMDNDSYSCHDIDRDNLDPNDYWYDNSDEEAPTFTPRGHQPYIRDVSHIYLLSTARGQHHSSHQPRPMTIHPSPPAIHSQDATYEPISNRLRSKTKTNL
jgi:hypothetical protein